MGEKHADAEVICKAVSGTGLAALAAGNLAAAGERFRRALPLCTEAGEAGTWMSSLAHIWLGTAILLQGDSVGAVAEVEQGLRIARARGDRLSIYVALYNLSAAAIASADHDGARRYLEEGIALSEQTSDLANLAYFLDALAVVESASGAHQRVAVLVGTAQAFRETVGSVYAYYVPDQTLREAAEKGARKALGEDAYDDAVDLGRSHDLPAAVAFALHRHDTRSSTNDGGR
jgi:tetratricopeptide (TPR) repeat protein